MASPSEWRNEEPTEGKKIGNNNQEEEEEGDNGYGTEDFDDESVGSSRKIAESEDEDYPNDNVVTDGDDRTAFESLATTTTGRDSSSQVGPVTVTQSISTRQEVEAAVGATEIDSKFHSYDDDFADDDSIVVPPQPEAPTGFDGENSTTKHDTEDEHRDNEPANAIPRSYRPPLDQSLVGKPTADSDSYGSDMDWVGSDHDVCDDGGKVVNDGLSVAQKSKGAKVTRDDDGIRVNDDDAVSDQKFSGTTPSFDGSLGSDMGWVGSDHDVGDDEGIMVDDVLSAVEMSAEAKVTRDDDGIRVNDDDAVSDQTFGDTTPSFDGSLVEDPRGKHQVAMEKETMRRRVTEENTVADDGGGCGMDKDLEMLRKQVDAVRAVLISSLDDDEDNRERSLLELVLLAESRSCKTRAENSETASRATATTELRAKKSSTAAAAAAAASLRVESTARAELEKRVESLERDLARAGQESRMQSGRAASLQRRLDAIEAGNDDVVDGRLVTSVDGHDNGPEEAVVKADIIALKHKVVQLVERLRQEKYARLKSERDAQKTRKKPKIQMLSDHIEKLMVFLKHEATQRAKAHEQQRRLQKELGLVKARNSALLRSNQAKDRATVELREGSKILEDQLRLMDEKYMELRMKLDWTRTKAEKDVRKARAQASALRSKCALLCGGGRMGACPLLDSAKVDVAAPLRTSASVPDTTSKKWRQGVSGGGYGFNEAGRKSKQQRQHRDYQLRFHGVPSQGGGDWGDFSLITDCNRRPETAESGKFHSRRRDKIVGIDSRRGQGMVPSMSAPSLISKHQNPHGQQQRCTASSRGVGGMEAGDIVKEGEYTQQQFRAVSSSPRAGGSNYPNARIAAGGREASSPKGSNNASFDSRLSAQSNLPRGVQGGCLVNSRVGGEKSSGVGVSGNAAGHGFPLGDGGERDGGGGDGGRGASKLLYA